MFAEVLTDYTDPEGNIAIDCYPDHNPNSTNARVVARISIDGVVIKGDRIKESDFQCPLVIEAIKEVQEEQKKIKQELINKVADLIDEDCRNKDLTAIEVLLMSCPAINLKSYLKEEA